MRLTIPHYFEFGEDAAVLPSGLTSADAWDALRTETGGAFAIPRDRGELERQADARPEIGERARSLPIAGSLASYGAGVGLIELWLLRLHAGLQLTVTDYGPATVERLSGLLPEARVVQHNLRAGPLPADLHLFHRVDTEFSNRQWRSIFKAFRRERVVFVPGGLKTDEEMRTLLREMYRSLRYTRRLRGVQAGRVRTQAAMEALWSRSHRGTRTRFHDLAGWLLDPR